ncbi:MAG: hypothetical protein P4M00_12685 [Azospirillaceae bacterium]|nr:hypothetical protein [Azospirillaceae bacterium]
MIANSMRSCLVDDNVSDWTSTIQEIAERHHEEQPAPITKLRDRDDEPGHRMAEPELTGHGVEPRLGVQLGCVIEFATVALANAGMTVASDPLIVSDASHDAASSILWSINSVPNFEASPGQRRPSTRYAVIGIAASAAIHAIQPTFPGMLCCELSNGPLDQSQEPGVASPRNRSEI